MDKLSSERDMRPTLFTSTPCSRVDAKERFNYLISLGDAELAPSKLGLNPSLYDKSYGIYEQPCS